MCSPSISVCSYVILHNHINHNDSDAERLLEHFLSHDLLFAKTLGGTGIEIIFWHLVSFSTPLSCPLYYKEERERERENVLTLLQLGFWARFRFCHSNACCSNALRQDLEWGFPGGSDGKESTCIVRDLDLISGLGRSPGGGHGNLLQYSCLENPHGQKCLAGFRPRGHKELDMTERLAQHKVWK